MSIPLLSLVCASTCLLESLARVFADCLPGLPPRLTPRIASQDCLQARLLNAKQLFGVDGGHCNLTIRPCHDYVWVSAVGVCCRPSSLPLRRRLCLCINVSASLSLPLSVCLSLSGVSASVCLSIFVCLCLHQCICINVSASGSVLGYVSVSVSLPLSVCLSLSASVCIVVRSFV